MCAKEDKKSPPPKKDYTNIEKRLSNTNLTKKPM
jgi:hypothetical protein